MINILFPSIHKKRDFFKESFFPKLLVEISEKSMLQRTIENFEELEGNKIFIFNKEECDKFHLDKIAKLLIPDCITTIQVTGKTAGALCTCLMAISCIDDENELIISNSDQVIHADLPEVIKAFSKQETDCGVICFDSVHPRWSYVKETEGRVTETAEKRPISKKAVAGFYYFKQGKDFVSCAQKVLLKDNALNNSFYISATINEMILMGKKVSTYSIDRDQYSSFYSLDKIKQFEKKHGE